MREMRLVIGESSATSEAAKPNHVRMAEITASKRPTDISRLDEEVVVCQGTIFLRVEQVVDIKTIAGLVLLEYFEGISPVQLLEVSVERDAIAGNISISDGHFATGGRTAHVYETVILGDRKGFPEKKRTSRKFAV